MPETIETGLVYIYRRTPTRKFVGCGALIEGSYIATCRHVWRDATAGDDGEPLRVEIEYPRCWDNEGLVCCPAKLADTCTPHEGPLPDLVLLRPENIPSAAMSLQLAAHERFEVGEGYAHARLSRTDSAGRETWRDMFADGRINPNTTGDGLRQFTGDTPQGYWFTSGSSGSPIFLKSGQQLAGILSLSELGSNENISALHEAFVVPATTIRQFVVRLAAQPVAEKTGADLQMLQPILDALGVDDVAIAEIPSRIAAFIAEARAHAVEPVPPSNDGDDIDAVISASRDKLLKLDVPGARALLSNKISEEIEARTRRLAPLLKERANVERIAFDHEAAKATLRELTKLTPGDVWSWIELGDLWTLTGSLGNAIEAYSSAEAAARTSGDERAPSVSKERIGDVLVARGDLGGALTAYREGLAIREGLAERDPGNTLWQRDLSISKNKIGDVLVAQGDLGGALTAYREGLAI
ncbi:MAG TPA: tetratricopeptide repeat protein, partial [Stellaceae bacterium]|nr:tetratricopeptide repeat protein [Stellaceae bacterium]